MKKFTTHSLLLVGALSTPVAAQGLLIPPTTVTQSPPDQGVSVTPPQLRPATPQVTLQRSAIRAEIIDGVATTVVEQTFRNHGRREAEGIWFLPLPLGAVADGFTMSVGGKELAGEVLDATQARGVYESIVRRKRDPGLLEYAGNGMLRARVYPIPAGGDVVVTVRLRQILQPLGNVFEWQWPLRSAQYGDTGSGPLSMDVKIRSQTRISTVVTPQGNADIERKGDYAARVTFEGSGDQLEDLRVLYGLSEQEFGLHLLTWRQMADPGYFVMLLSPPRELDHNIPRRCVQFVVDTSGSMKGDKIEQAKRALGMFLKSLRPQDLFQVVTFSSSVQTFFDGPRRANAENIGVALERVGRLEAKGGTNIADALQVAFGAEVPAGDDDGPWLGQIVFVTDGQPTVGMTAPQQILALAKRKDRQKMRLFALGVGNAVDVRLIDDLVQQHRGARDFVRNKEKIEIKVDALCQKIAKPALTDVEVRCEALDSFDVHPSRTRDLFCGEMLQVVGRYRNAGMQTVRVLGQQNGKPREFVFEVEFPKISEQHSFVQTIWARQHVASLLGAIRRNGAQKELVDEVKRLATRYGIVTPYTSQLIVEESERLANVRRDSGTPGAPQHLFYLHQQNPTGGPGAFGGRTAAPGSPVASRGLGSFGSARSGAEAVAESLETDSVALYLGAKARGPADSVAGTAIGRSMGSVSVRRAAGRVFVAAGQDLVEQGLPADWQKKAVVIAAFSDDYFALLRGNPKLREVFALGSRVVFRDGARIIHVKPTESETKKKGESQPAIK